MSCNKVELYVYDLSKGVAAMMSPMFIGKRIDGIWHTSIVVYEREYFFGSGGVESCIPGRTSLGAPLRIVHLGETEIPYPVFIDYLNELGTSAFTGSTYSLLTHNCNNFSNELAQFLCAASIPSYILDLPNEVLNTPLGAAIPALIGQLEQSARPLAEETSHTSNSHLLNRSHTSSAVTANAAGGAGIKGSTGNRKKKENSPDLTLLDQQIEEARYNSFVLEERRKRLRNKLVRKERKLEKKKQKLLQEGKRVSIAEGTATEGTAMEDTETVNGSAETQLPSEQAMQIEAEERLEEEERKKSRDPPVIFKDLLDINVEFDALVGLIDGKLSPEEQTSLEELHKFMMEDEGSWVLGENFLVFIGRLLNDKDLPNEVRIRTLNVLALAALKDDIILMLHQDRREHILMNYAFDIDRSSPEEQKSLALMVANLFENLSSSEWLLYISEWTYNNQPTSNIRCTTKVAVHSLLSDDATLQDRGSAIIHNLACKEVKTVVFDDVAVELTMALLQYFNSKPNEEQLFRCMKALAKFIQISRQEVPQLIQMIGPDPKSFKGTSARIDELIDFISSKCRF